MSLYYSVSTFGFYDDINWHTKLQIPADAVCITNEQYQDLYAAQSSGKLITLDSNGNLVVTDSPSPTNYQVSTAERAKRDALISETDYLLMPDYPITTEKLALVKGYRQLLRDITKQSGFPTSIDWPSMPE